MHFPKTRTFFAHSPCKDESGNITTISSIDHIQILSIGSQISFINKILIQNLLIILHHLLNLAMSRGFIFLSSQQSLSFSLSFMILMYLKSIGLLFYRMSLNLSMSEVSSWLGPGYAFLLRIPKMLLCLNVSN